ncbi:hypothetical protein PAXRUDRAFT_216048 [Paxillus rubicundulus Ve08.2h10]|uniref:Uncharacterized protein n=1 Tax=Paxillus rubicundulus Ve08.2h10 TaxID=930991 RepID=A0A0D0DHE0_9AGAM|nr:hypothetical protein PAXRUDRAFT_216048 [Paxillus rubicundulus Ve08.2h10]
MSRNFVVDASSLYVGALHPVASMMKQGFSGYARFRTRTQRPPRYLFMDFGLSRRYDPSVFMPLEVPIWGRMCHSFRTPMHLVILSQPTYSTSVMPLIIILLTQTLNSGYGRIPLNVSPWINEVVKWIDTVWAGLRSWELRSRVFDERLDSSICVVKTEGAPGTYPTVTITQMRKLQGERTSPWKYPRLPCHRHRTVY